MVSRLLVSIIICLIGNIHLHAFTISKSDTLSAYQYFVKARQLRDSSSYDSATVFYQKAAEVYKNENMWPRYITSILAVNEIRIEQLSYTYAELNLLEILPVVQKSVGNWHADIAKIYTLLGSVRRKMGNFDQALTDYEKGLEIREKNNITGEALAESYYFLGITWRIKGKFDKALEFHEKCLAINRNTFGDNHTKVARSHCEMAVVYKNSGKYGRAMELYKSSMNIFLQTVDSLDFSLASTYNGMAIIHAQTGNYSQALDYFNKLLIIDQNKYGQDHPDLAMTYTNLGILNEIIGDYNQALDLHHKSLKIKLKVLGKDHKSLSYDYKGLAAIYKIRQDMDQALLFLQRAIQLDLASLGPNHPELGPAYNLLGGIYLDKEDLDKALEYYRESERIVLASNKNSPVLGPTYHDIALIYQKKRQFDEALGFGKKALDINTSSLGPNHFYLAENHMLLGNIHRDMGTLEKALEHYHLAQNINEKAGRDVHIATAKAYYYLAMVNSSLGNHAKALGAIQKALVSVSEGFDDLNIKSNPPPESAIDASQMIAILGQKGIMLYQLYRSSLKITDLTLSFDVLQQTISLIDEVRASYKSEGSVEIFRKGVSPIFETAVEVAYELYHKTNETDYMEQAFEFTEKSKASLLMAALQESKAQKFAGVPDSLLQQERSLKQDLNFYERQLFEEAQKNENSDSIKIAFYQNKKFSLKRSYDTLTLMLETAYPNYYHLKYNTNVVNIETVKSELLSENDVLVEYFISDSSIFIFAIGEQLTEFIKVKKYSGLAQDISALRDILTLKTDEPDRFASLAHNLYRSLLAPLAASRMEGFHLIISPDGELAYLPFELLVKNAVEPGKNFIGLPYLLNDHQISYTYSASMLQEVLQKRSSTSVSQYLAMAPDFNAREIIPEKEEALMAMNTPVRGALVELEGTGREVAAINDLFGGSFYEGAEATELQFKLHAQNYGILHLATHAIVDDENPMNSRLLFTVNQDSTEDGDLYAWELYNMQLNAEMAVLSACNTGSGKLQHGEGVKSLGWAFTYAGCRSIVMSLWPAQDQSTADLMTYFYQGLSKGHAKDRAMREAKLKYLENAGELFSHPFYWAGFVVQGNPRPITLNASDNYLWVGFGMLLSGLIIFLLYKRKKGVS